MPSKMDDSENLRFLYACLQESDYNRINYAAVAQRFGIQSPAARMRFHRLRDALDGKTGSKVRKAKATGDIIRKQRGAKRTGQKEGLETKWKGLEDDDDDDDEELVESKKAGGKGRFKKEESEEEDDCKVVLGANVPFVNPGIAPQPYVQQTGAMMPLPPPPSPAYQMQMQTKPETMTHGLLVPHAYFPQASYYQPASMARHPEQQQQEQPDQAGSSFELPSERLQSPPAKATDAEDAKSVQ